MSEAVATVQVKQEPTPGIAVSGTVPIVTIIVLILLLYARIGTKLVTDWYELPDFSHGFLIPFFAAYLLWERRKQIRQVESRPSWTAVPLVLLSLVVLMVGIFGADLFLARISFILLSAGLVWLLAGIQLLRIVGFPIAILILGVPLPAVVFNQMTFPLQILASQLAAALLPLAGVPVLREGNVINLPSMQLEVAEACSGIRSMMSLFTVAVLFGYFFEEKGFRRFLLALCSVPIAVAANALRIFGTGVCVQYWNPDKAVGFFHEFSGWLMFLVSLACLYLVHFATRSLGRRRVSSPA